MDVLAKEKVEEAVRRVGLKHMSRTVQARAPGVYAYINARFPKLARRKFSEKAYWLAHGMEDFPKCPVCGRPVTLFLNMARGYAETCSQPCGVRWRTAKAGQSQLPATPENDRLLREKALALGLNLHGRGYQARLASLAPDVYAYAASRYPQLEGRRMAEKLHWLLNGLNGFPKCAACGREMTAFRNVFAGYSRHCPGCAASDGAVRAKISAAQRRNAADPAKKVQTVQARRRTKAARYGDPEYNNTEKAVATKMARYGSVQPGAGKAAETKAARYGDPRWNNAEKRKKTCLEKYGSASYSQTAEFLDKVRHTNMERRGVEFPGQSAECRTKQKETIRRHIEVDPGWKQKIVDRVNATKRRNKTFCSSRLELAVLAALQEKFGSDNVEYQYSDTRYPYSCDFYVKSQDMFIECNFHWTHGLHWFDPSNPVDTERLSELKARAEQKRRERPGQPNLYENAIDVWTRRDPIKKKTAESNRLNYVVFWKFNDIMAWLNDLE